MLLTHPGKEFIVNALTLPALSGNSRAGVLCPTLHHILLKSEPTWWRKMELGPMALIFGQQIVKDQ